MQKEYKGFNGTLKLTETGIEISRPTGLKALLITGGMLRGDKSIPYSGIIGVELKKAGHLTGYIRITLQGSAPITGGLFESTRDNNSITFQNSEDNASFEEAKRLIEERIGMNTKNTNTIDELERLAVLKDKGILTEEEFSLKKKLVLGI